MIGRGGLGGSRFVRQLYQYAAGGSRERFLIFARSKADQDWSETDALSWEKPTDGPFPGADCCQPIERPTYKRLPCYGDCQAAEGV